MRRESYEQLIEEVDTIWKFASSGDDRDAMRAFVDDIEQNIGLSCEMSGDYRLDIARAPATARAPASPNGSPDRVSHARK